MRRMSNFVLDSLATSSSSSSRLGRWTVSSSGGETPLSVPTPAFLVHTLGGSVPHLTADVLLQHVFPEQRPPLLVSIDNCATFVDSVAQFGSGIAKFAGLPQFPVFLSPHNPGKKVLPSGYNIGESVALWGRRGKTALTVAEHQRIVAAFKPQFFQTLSDYDISSTSGLKRMKKSTTRTLEFLDKTTSGSSNGADLFATVELGWFKVDGEEANKTVKAMLTNKLDAIKGFIISGVTLSLSPNKTEGQKKGPMNNKKRTQMDTEKKSSLNSTPVEDKADEDDKSTDSTKTSDLDYAAISEVVALLPAHLPRYVPGPLSPYEILELVLLGVDLFDSSWVTASADLGHVLVLDELTKYFPDGHEVKINNESLPGGKNGDEGTNSSNETGCTISIKDKKYFSDFTPLSSSCSCYTCRKHTKSYLNHLYATEELLGPVLVMIHNLTSFNTMMATIRHVVKKDAGVSSQTESSTSSQESLDRLKQCLKPC
ncbi:queuine tRNA-ribosyltransferase accessory subunit 2 [Folsomia candida]|uniref:queuine tRNA-ribosyltransferase accessory subunit 2 n=1 Tax=Folsomia candida TaxID=158441 RepID=UPI000B8FE36E|nr:queuine tRNA-ribosyltransferase accessory subunit 2 [Folsomia candida]